MPRRLAGEDSRAWVLDGVATNDRIGRLDHNTTPSADS